MILIQCLLFWAKFSEMYWLNMCLCGAGCVIIIANASMVLGPHSILCGLNLGVIQFTHMEVEGLKSGLVFLMTSCFRKVSVWEQLRSSA